ncbi:MAG: right-handed parallel beta-helix repeat-containing protein, partial [Candidatus Brocadiaceae bacterium]
GNYIARNSAYWMGGGIYVAGSSRGHIRIAGNTIYRNHTDQWGGGLMIQGTNLDVASNSITHNSAGKTGGGVAVPAGSGSFTANTVAWNEGDGLRIISDSRWRLSRNSIYANSGLGVELEEDGPTPNDEGDADEGANDLQNYPVLSAASSDGASTKIAGTLNSTPNAGFTIEFFANEEVDPSGYGEGQRYVGSTTVTTDADGEAAFEVILPVAVEEPDLITATATSAEGHTSEFSRPVGRRTGRAGRR